MSIGPLLKAKRKEHGLTQAQLAEKIFVSRQAISSWETDKTYPDIANLVMLSELYHLPIETLLPKDRPPVAPLPPAPTSKAAPLFTGALFLLSLAMVIIALLQKDGHFGLLLADAFLSLLLLSGYAYHLHKTGRTSERILYTIAFLLILIFAVATFDNIQRGGR